MKRRRAALHVARVGMVSAVLLPGVLVAIGAASADSPPSSSSFAASIEGTTLEGPATIAARGGLTTLPALPHVTAAAYMVYDATDHQLLAAHAAHQSRAIASLTKMMTAIVVLQHDKPGDMVTISRTAVDTDDGSALGMSAGQRYPVRELFTAMLVHSANDAAEAFAEHTGYAAFVADMNTEARQLGMDHTHFTSPHGLDSVPGNRSTAADVLILARAAMQFPQFRAAVSTRSYRFTRPNGTASTYPNRNTLLGSYPGVDGIKTGFTDDAGECLVTHLRDEAGDDLYVVDLGSSSESTRDSDSRALLTWGKAARVRVIAVAHAAAAPVRVPTAYDGGSLALRIPADLGATVLIGHELTVTAQVPGVISGSVRAGQQLGWLDLDANGQVVAREPLLAARAVAARSRLSRVETLARRVRHAWAVGIHALI